MPRSPHRHRPRVLIAGGGVAGLETLLALHAPSGDLLDLTILALELKFINRSMSVEKPFQPQRVRGLRRQKTAVEFGARWHKGTRDRVEPERRLVVTGTVTSFRTTGSCWLSAPTPSVNGTHRKS